MAQPIAIGAPLGSDLGLGLAGAAAAPSSGVLFGQLVQAGLGTEGGSIVAANTIVSNTPASEPITSEAEIPNITAPNIQSAVTLGALPIQIEGATTEAQAVQVLSQTITIIYQQLTVQGFQFKGHGQTGDLAAALTKLGVPAEEAQGIAAKIETMLELLSKQLEDQEQELSPDLGTSLIAVLVAALLPQQENLSFNVASALQSQTVSLTQTTVQISLSQTTTQMVQLAPQKSEFASARDALFSPFSAPQQAPILVHLKTESVPQLAVAVLPQTAVNTEALPQQTLSATPVQIVLPVNLPANLPSNLPEVLPPTGSVAQEAKALVSTATSTASFMPVVQTIEAPKKIEGTTIYRLIETPTGTAVLQAVAPAPVTATPAPAVVAPEALPTPVLASGKLMEAGSESGPDTSVLVSENTASNFVNTAPQLAATAPRFAERLAQAQQHQALQQVAIAIQPLLNNGQGGSVRMTLNPPELGRIEIHLKIEAGQVSGAIAASEPAVVEHLARELPSLRQALADAGLRLGDQGLSLMLGQQPDGRDQNQPNPFAGREQNGQGQRHENSSQSGVDDTSGTVSAVLTLNSRWVSPERVLDTEV